MNTIDFSDIIHHPVFLFKNLMDNVQKVSNCINIPSSQTYHAMKVYGGVDL
jgi:hypothetical protein